MKIIALLTILAMRNHEIVGVQFDAAAQYVDTTGAHAFKAPGPNDQRGVCPGLNALANHRYLPHNGIVTITQLVDAVTAVFGMGIDLAEFLSAYGFLWDGNGVKLSIHGPSEEVTMPLNIPKGLTGSHNNYEGDGSPTRCDLDVCGNCYLLCLDRWSDFYDKNKTSYDMDDLTNLRHKRFHQSLNENPYFFVAPFSGAFVTPAAYTFIYRFMANHTSEHPEGHLGPEVLKSFFSLTEDASGKFSYAYGHERIPDNWYRRAFGDEYTIPFFLTDVLAAAEKHPEFLAIGGNTGKVNSFFGVDPKNMSGGVFNGKNLAENNNLFCYFFSLMEATPNVNEFPQIQLLQPATKHFSQFSSFASRFDCPQLERFDPDAFQPFPGFTRIGVPDPGVVVKTMEKFNCSTRPLEDKPKDKKRNKGQ